MQAILIMLPILVYAAIAGVALFYVLFVLLPRLRRRKSGSVIRAPTRKP
jgi:hypothetical protein